ncbi:MAG: tRNA 2-thiouridine(34) synthase MnmA [Ignavibacteriales bacterium]|nr:MAG: tRNA 2-thiouridine(34) synthase MnmA [Ignavibacteriales bacterium]
MKIAVLLSGGVDSSVALRLLKEEGHDLTAYYLKIWLQDEFSFLGDCPWEEDLKYARDVCDQADVELKVLPLQEEYWASVVSYTIDEIKEGRTPNPDIYCNSLIKFGQFYEKIDSSFDKVASGHYAGVINENDLYKLKCSPDPVKDQTYFLAYLTQAQISRALFPLNKYMKKDVRELAEKYSLPTMHRRDSQGICFLGQIKFNEFVKHHLGEIPGDIIDVDSGKILGKHHGYYYFTIGQRSGLGLSGGPWYVVNKDVKENLIYISRENKAMRERKIFDVGKFNWIADKPSGKNLRVKIRHGARFYDCSLEIEKEEGIVRLKEADQGIAPGQFAVFYENDYCLGGAVIIS